VAATLERRAGTNRVAPTRLEYVDDYPIEHFGGRGHLAVSERFPVDFVQHDLPTFPAFALDLMPQGEARRGLEARLREAKTASTDWEVLRRGAASPVGNVRVVESIDEAPPPPIGVPRTEIITRGDRFREWAESTGIPVAGSSDTVGASPKLLMAEDEEGLLHADGALPDDRARRHFIIKFPRGRTRRDAQVLGNEAPYLEVLRFLGLDCGAPLVHESEALFIPRFDRAWTGSGVERRGMESMYALMGIVESGAKLAFEEVCQALASVVDDAKKDVVELVLRDAAALALGNTDNHGRNTSLLKHVDGQVRLSPIYDFAPMFLDPELVKRSTLWRSEPPAGGVPDWTDVCESLAGIVPRDALSTALRDLGERLEALPAKMRDLGVDDEIIERRERPIDDIARKLTALRGG
jgi:serine/threonine-protein kinase HipA